MTVCRVVNIYGLSKILRALIASGDMGGKAGDSSRSIGPLYFQALSSRSDIADGSSEVGD